jgi:tetratricopeptide (TPR) repeat protein
LRVGVLVWLLALAAVSGAARADQNDARLGPLFERLAAAPGPIEAELVEGQIWRLWAETPDPASRSLYESGVAAMERRDLRAAREALDRLVAQAPGFAEAWNKRATLAYLTGDDEASIADIRRTLALEPRHFGALSGLGLICLRLVRPTCALASFEAALAIHPFLPGARVHVEMLREQLKGDPT